MILSSPHLASRPVRIISLVPSQTELLHYLGLEEETIAITKFCIHPKDWFQNKTRIGGTKAIDIEKIVSLQPDLIIANKEENVKEQVEALATHPVWVTNVNNLPDAYQMIRDIGQLTVTSATGSALIAAVQNEFSELHAGSDPIPVAYLVWKDPYMTIGGDTFIHDMLEKAGMKNVFEAKRRYPEITIPQLRASGCKMLLLSSEPYPFAQKHIAELSHQLPGIKIKLVDGEMFSWYGSRLLEAARYFKTFLLRTCS